MRAVDYIRNGWTQQTRARNANGKACSPESEHAVKWCLEGALIAAYGAGQKFRDTKSKLQNQIGAFSLASWNDTPGRTKQEVIEALEKARV